MNSKTEQNADRATDLTLELAQTLDKLILKVLDCVNPDFRPIIYYHTLVSITATMFIRLESKDKDLSVDAKLSNFKKDVLGFIEEYRNEEHK